jgi:hypothetical protein
VRWRPVQLSAVQVVKQVAAAGVAALLGRWCDFQAWLQSPKKRNTRGLPPPQTSFPRPPCCSKNHNTITPHAGFEADPVKSSFRILYCWILPADEAHSRTIARSGLNA